MWKIKWHKGPKSRELPEPKPGSLGCPDLGMMYRMDLQKDLNCRFLRLFFKTTFVHNALLFWSLILYYKQTVAQNK